MYLLRRTAIFLKVGLSYGSVYLQGMSDALSPRVLSAGVMCDLQRRLSTVRCTSEEPSGHKTSVILTFGLRSASFSLVQRIVSVICVHVCFYFKVYSSKLVCLALLVSQICQAIRYVLLSPRTENTVVYRKTYELVIKHTTPFQDSSSTK